MGPAQFYIILIWCCVFLGSPKGVLSSHYGVVNNIYFSGKRLHFHEEPQVVCIQVGSKGNFTKTRPLLYSENYLSFPEHG